MKNIFRGVLIGIALAEVYRVLKKNGVLNCCQAKLSDYVKGQRRKRKYTEYRSERESSYFGE